MLMEIVAWVAAVLVFACFFMKTIVPLRVIAMAGNLAFILYAALGWQAGILSKVLPILVLHAALLPLNFIRLREVTRTSKALRGLANTSLPFDFLIPFMTVVRQPSGHTLFHLGDTVEDVYIIKSGSVALKELGKQLGPGAIFGEVAVFSSHASRTATAECSSDCEFYKIAGTKVLELFYQDRKFSFQIARLLAGYAHSDPAPRGERQLAPDAPAANPC